MSTTPINHYIVVHTGGLVVSIIEGIVTFAGFAALLWFNHQYLGGNVWIDLAFIIIWFLSLATRQSSRRNDFNSEAEAIKWLQDQIEATS